MADSGAAFGGDEDSDPTDGSGSSDTFFNDANVTNDQDRFRRSGRFRL